MWSYVANQILTDIGEGPVSWWVLIDTRYYEQERSVPQFRTDTHPSRRTKVCLTIIAFVDIVFPSFLENCNVLCEEFHCCRSLNEESHLFADIKIAILGLAAYKYVGVGELFSCLVTLHLLKRSGITIVLSPGLPETLQCTLFVDPSNNTSMFILIERPLQSEFIFRACISVEETLLRKIWMVQDGSEWNVRKILAICWFRLISWRYHIMGWSKSETKCEMKFIISWEVKREVSLKTLSQLRDGFPSC